MLKVVGKEGDELAVAVGRRVQSSRLNLPRKVGGTLCTTKIEFTKIIII